MIRKLLVLVVLLACGCSAPVVAPSGPPDATGHKFGAVQFPAAPAFVLASPDAQGGTQVVESLDGGMKKIEADVLLPFFGLSMSLGPLADWSLALERNQIVVDPATSATSRTGIFGVGDVVTYPGKLKLILTGFSEAAIAARSAYALIHPETPLHFEYSTTSGVPDA